MVSLTKQRAVAAEPVVEAAEPPPSPFDAVLRQLLLEAEPSRGTIVGITSAVAGEGKTMSVAELAQRLSYWATRERPVLAVACGQAPAPPRPPPRSARAGEPPLRRRPALVYRSLGSLRAAGLPTHAGGLAGAFDDLRRRHGFVVLDLPPLLGEPVALELARAADRLYLVVRAGSTPADLVRQAVELVGRERPVGVILNRAGSCLPRWLAPLVP